MPRFFRAALGLGVVLCLLARAHAAEVQAHGLVFETWVRETFFPAYQVYEYTAKWDIPASANFLPDPALAGLPVNPKAARFGSAVGLGDALRQFDIDEPFLLVVGYWEQDGPREKRLVKILAPRIEPAAWRALWGPVTRADLERLDAVIKDRSLTPAEARRRAQELKDAPPFSGAVFVLNPKIDSGSQRRLQVSLRYEDLIKHLAPGATADPDATPALWGKPFPGVIESAPRRRARPRRIPGVSAPPSTPAASWRRGLGAGAVFEWQIHRRASRR
jgi:hypothetical protein